MSRSSSNPLADTALTFHYGTPIPGAMDEECDVFSSNAAEVVQGTEGTIARFFEKRKRRKWN
jgi:hypothetical protein